MKRIIFFLVVAISAITTGVQAQTQPTNPSNSAIMPPNNPNPTTNPYPNNGFTPPLNNTVPSNNTIPPNNTNTIYPYNPSPIKPYNPNRHLSDSIRRRDSLKYITPKR